VEIRVGFFAQRLCERDAEERTGGLAGNHPAREDERRFCDLDVFVGALWRGVR
jgi:hypothetical protein